MSRSRIPGAPPYCSQISFPGNSAGMRTVQSVCLDLRDERRVCSCLRRQEAEMKQRLSQVVSVSSPHRYERGSCELSLQQWRIPFSLYFHDTAGGILLGLLRDSADSSSPNPSF